MGRAWMLMHFYAFLCVTAGTAIARLSHCNTLSVCHMGRSVKKGAS